jgi:hypothetical protein
MLTRHLYRYDEVKQSLLYCIHVQRIEEAIFWTMELVDSFCAEEILPLCFQAWILGIGWKGFGFLSLFQSILEKDEIDENILYELVYSLAHEKERDGSVYGLLMKGVLVSSQIDRVVPMMLEEQFKNLSQEQQFLVSAIKQKKILLAWTFLRNRWSEDTFTLLDSLCEDYQKVAYTFLRSCSLFGEKFLWEQRALLLLCLCAEKGSFKEKALKPLSPSLVQVKEEWAALEGRRKRRIHKILTEAILWGTERSLQPNMQTNMAELMDPRASLKGCPYWEEVAASMGSWAHIRKVDDLKEAFYDMYFPDDIPDEWSSKDREKSHGYGLLIGTNIANQQYKGWKSFLNRLPTLGLVSTTQECLQKYNWQYMSFAEAYEKTPYIEEWIYEPIKKKIVVKKMN